MSVLDDEKESQRGETRKALRIHGRVQGVGFRWWTRKQAERLGLRGIVRNRPDGSVDVALVGPAGSVARMERLLQEGPRGAHVRWVEALPTPEGDFDGFQIAF